MTIGEQIKAAFADIKASLTGSAPATPEKGKAPEGATKPENVVELPKGEAPKAGAGAITEEIKAAIQAELKPVQEQLSAANASVTDLKAQITAKDQEISKLKGEQTSVEKAAAEKARQITAGQGIPEGKLPEGNSEGKSAEAELEAVRKEMAAEENPEKRSALAVKARKLRGHEDLFSGEKK